MGNRSAVKKVLAYIEDNLDADLTLEKIAKELNYSRFYIAREFADQTGCTVYKYIQGRRLTKAAQKLTDSGQPIIEIAYEARYGSQQAFTLAFRKLYGCTPQEYRNRGVFSPKQNVITLRLCTSCSNCERQKGGRMAT